MTNVAQELKPFRMVVQTLADGGSTRARRSAVVGVVAILTVLALVSAGVSNAAEAPVGLGRADKFAVLAGAGVTNTGPTMVNGDLGTCPTPAVTGFGPGTVNGNIHQNDADACGAQQDLIIAYNDAAGRAPTQAPFAGVTDLGSTTLTPGVYKADSSLAVTGTLTLDAQGDANAVFIFQVASTLLIATDSEISLINGAQACNVFWQVGSSATLEVRSKFVGTIMALTSIEAKTNATVQGRLLARTASVTLDSNIITRPSCATLETTTSTAAPSTSTAAPSTTAAPTVTTMAEPTVTAPPAGPGVVVPSPTASPIPPTPGAPSTPSGPSAGATTTTPGRPAITGGPARPGGPGAPQIPRTGSSPWEALAAGLAATAFGGQLVLMASRRRQETAGPGLRPR